MLLRKPLYATAFATVIAAAALSPKAHAADPLLGALIGGGIGAAIGHDVNHHNGAAAGAAIGAVLGAGIASSSNYYDGYGYAPPPAPGYYPPAAPEYYAPAPAPYYAPPPAYYAPSVVVGYSSYPHYAYYGGHRHYARHWH